MTGRPCPRPELLEGNIDAVRVGDRVLSLSGADLRPVLPRALDDVWEYHTRGATLEQRSYLADQVTVYVSERLKVAAEMKKAEDG